MKATIDTREPEPLGWALANRGEIDECAAESLSAGDIVIDGVGFERKIPADFAASLVDGRLHDQAPRLLEAFEHAFILIEGDMGCFEELDHSVPASNLRGMVASLTAKHGIPVLFCGDRSGLVDMAVRLAEQAGGDVDVPIPTGPVTRDAPTALRLYAAIPGVGESRARTLHESYPRVAELLRADVSDVATLDGIGTGTAETVVGAFSD